MTRSTRKTMLLLLMLLGIVYLVLHALVRTGAVQEMTASYLESRTGYAATVGAVRFTPGLSLLLRDVSLEAVGHAGATNEVFRAPYARLQPWCRRRIFWAQRAEITLRQAGNGVWEPAFVPETEISRETALQFFHSASLMLGELCFSLEQASVSVVGRDRSCVFFGLNWTRKPLRIESRPGAMLDELSLHGVTVTKDGVSHTDSKSPSLVADVWIEADGRAVSLAAPESASAAPAPAVPAVPAEAPAPAPEAPAPAPEAPAPAPEAPAPAPEAPAPEASEAASAQE